MNNEIDTRKVADWLNKKWEGGKGCPICNSNDWNIGAKAAELREFAAGSLVVGAPVYPLITVTCNVCGHTLLFNAVVAGLVETKKKETIPPVDTQADEEEERRRRL